MDWLNTQTGGGYRLLTEVEWEYAAGGGENAVYPWGNDAANGCRFANGFDQSAVAMYQRMDTSGYKVYDPLTCTDGWLNTTPVGSLKPNAFGVHDMIGNISESIEDCHAPSHEAVSEAGAPPASKVHVRSASPRAVLGHTREQPADGGAISVRTDSSR